MNEKFYLYRCRECGTETKSLTKPLGDKVRCAECGSVEPKELKEIDRSEPVGRVRGLS